MWGSIEDAIARQPIVHEGQTEHQRADAGIDKASSHRQSGMASTAECGRGEDPKSGGWPQAMRRRAKAVKGRHRDVPLVLKSPAEGARWLLAVRRA